MTVLSIITPCYNEQAGIARCSEAVRAVMAAELPQYDYEHIFIDNCSQDRTVAIFREIAASDRRVKIIVNSRNFGPARSPFHAMLQSTGDAAIPILADLQTPPYLDSEHGQALAGRRQGRHRRQAKQRRSHTLAICAVRIL